ncbi:hypothetical protein D3C72_2018620 [compost metagenome]
MLVDGHVAGQLCQRVGVAGRVDLHLRDFTHQVVARAHAQVAAVLGDDEAVEQVVGIGLHHRVAEFLQACLVVRDQGRGIHEQAA